MAGDFTGAEYFQQERDDRLDTMIRPIRKRSRATRRLRRRRILLQSWLPQESVECLDKVINFGHERSSSLPENRLAATHVLAYRFDEDNNRSSFG